MLPKKEPVGQQSGSDTTCIAALDRSAGDTWNLTATTDNLDIDALRATKAEPDFSTRAYRSAYRELRTATMFFFYLNKFKFQIAIVLCVAVLSGCAALDSGENSNRIKLKERYRDQLINQNASDYATIRGNPFADFSRNQNFSANPFVIEEFNSRKLREIDWKEIFEWRDPYYSEIKLRVPPGKHTIKIRGGGWRNVVYTVIRNVPFEPNKNYVLMQEGRGDGLYIYVAEYDEDTRFKPNEPESIVVRKKITTPLKVGAQ